MKKIISVLLVATLILSTLVTLTSCGGGVSVKDVEKDAYAVINTATQKAYDSFFTTDMGVGKVMKKMQEKGSVSFSLESKTLLEDNYGIGKISATTYLDMEKKAALMDLLVKYNEEDLSLRLFEDKAGITLVSQAIFGNENAYALNFASVLTGMDSSALFAMLELDGEAAAEIKVLVSTLQKSFDENAAKTEEEMADIYNAVLALLGQTAAEDEATGALVVTYTINNANLRSALLKLVESIAIDEAQKTDLTEIVTEVLDKLDASVTLSASYKTYIDGEEGSLLKSVFDATLTEKEGTESKRIEGVLTFAADAITYTLTGEDNTTVVFKLAKAVSETNDVYTLTVTGTEDGVTETPLTLSFDYKKADGSFVVGITSNVDGEDTVLSLNGNISVKENEAAFAITSVSMGEITLNLNLAVTLKAETAIPEKPANAKDLVTMTEDELMALVEGVMGGKLFEIIGSFMGDAAPDDDEIIWEGDGDYEGDRTIWPLI